MDFDDLLTAHVGEWGRGQLLVLLGASAGWATLAVAVLSMVFVTQTPPWSCTSADDALCQQQFLLQQHDPTALCKLTADQYSWDRPQVSLISTFGLVCDNSWMTGWANAVFFIGYAIGSSVFGWLADAHGRKAALLASSISTAAVTLLCAASTTYAMYITGRVLQGICCSGLPIAAYVLATESVGPTYRGRAGTGSQLVYHLGEWVLPAMALLLQDWRALYVAVAACCVLTAALAAAVPESPRWQLLHGRQGPAIQTLSWLAHLNGKQLPQHVVERLAAGGVEDGGAQDSKLLPAHDEAAAAAPVTANGRATAVVAVRAAGESDDGGADIDEASKQQQDSEVASLLCQHGILSSTSLKADMHARVHQQQLDQHGEHKQHKQQQRRHSQHESSGHTTARHAVDTVWMIFYDPLLARFFWVSSWVCTVMAAAFFTANLATEKLSGSLYVNFLLTSIGELPATVLGAIAVDAIGRRPTIATGLLVTGVACYACSLLRPGGWSTALASLGKSSCSSTWSLAYIYAAELMPTSVRSAALAGGNQAARLGGAVAPFIIYAGERMGHPKMPFALVGILSAATAAMTCLLPETRGKPQPDTMSDLHTLYGSSTDGNTGSSRAGAAAGGDDDICADVGVVARGGSLVQRLLSSSSSWRSLGRSGSSGSFSQRGQAVVQREGSELQAVVTDAHRPSPSLG